MKVIVTFILFSRVLDHGQLILVNQCVPELSTTNTS